MLGTIFHLIGTPGVGKYTIGRELAALTDARLVDNHSIANVVFSLIEVDGVTPLPDAIWPRYGQVRAAVLDTIANVSPPHLSFIFTNYMHGDSKTEYAAFLEMVSLADARGSLFVPVLLSCATSELRRRIVGEDRKARLKLVDPEMGAYFNDEVAPFRTDHPNALELDVTQIEPPAAARIIADWANSLA